MKEILFLSVPLQLDDKTQSDIPKICQLNQLNSESQDV